ncbi:ras association domain-containing protein 4 isoform X1 [Herpailurus yagouaroundi]|uniref:ras association domain-containing protein 4 isoform X1 n=1 Tax=Herpailurus yagouaroundi TaxID=1608482 RepID=UPI001AD6C4BE|nr:ras association domain-containing protein 4 isoform X1 [Puma yagouaroundi]
MKEDCPPSSHVPISDSKSILKSELLSLLKTYNCYHEGRSFQLRHREEEGALIIEGLLNIAWGLRRPIRLQIQDDRERVHLSAASWTPGQPSCHLKEPLLQDGKVAAQEPNAQTAPSTESSRDSSEPMEEDEETPQLMRTKSDAACVIQRRPRSRTPGEAQRIRRHRFSINGHFYNHKTSVFTPAYGSVTNVRVNSTMTTLHVLTLLLNKFRIMKTKVAVHLAGSMAVLLGQGATMNASARPKPSHPRYASQNPKGGHHLQPRSVGRGWGMCVGVRELELKVPPPKYVCQTRMALCTALASPWPLCPLRFSLGSCSSLTWAFALCHNRTSFRAPFSSKPGEDSWAPRTSIFYHIPSLEQ